jgi:hypothetical protein
MTPKLNTFPLKKLFKESNTKRLKDKFKEPLLQFIKPLLFNIKPLLFNIKPLLHMSNLLFNIKPLLHMSNPLFNIKPRFHMSNQLFKPPFTKHQSNTKPLLLLNPSSNPSLNHHMLNPPMPLKDTLPVLHMEDTELMVDTPQTERDYFE